MHPHYKRVQKDVGIITVSKFGRPITAMVICPFCGYVCYIPYNADGQLPHLAAPSVDCCHHLHALVHDTQTADAIAQFEWVPTFSL